jgi:hypothetical protein
MQETLTTPIWDVIAKKNTGRAIISTIYLERICEGASTPIFRTDDQRS